MTPRPDSIARQRADQLGGDSGVVRGPLKGYHHETYWLLLPGEMRTLKVREPRDEILWFDRRCFASEENLLKALQGRITCIPEIYDLEGMRFQRFIEGQTLSRHLLGKRRVPDALFDQIVALFRQLALITSDMLGTLDVQRRCAEADRAEEGDSADFLERLIAFSEEKVFEQNYLRFGGLFRELGVTGESFTRLRKNVSGLRDRPFCLLHADLHRKNFIVDSDSQLWAIDWELAMLGDPLYDLGTHIYLMGYPADQERRLAQEWYRVFDAVRPKALKGWEHDLPLILDFKKAQSVITDVIRTSQSLVLRDGAVFNWAGLPWAARKLQRVLEDGAGPLGMDEVPSYARVMGALTRWYRAEQRLGPVETA